MLRLRSEEGQATVEYALILVSLMVGILTLLYLLGPTIVSMFSKLISDPSNETPAVATCSSLRPHLGGPPVDVEVQFTSPGNCAEGLPRLIRASGKYEGDLTGREIWVLVYPTDSKYYPQTLDACKQAPAESGANIWNTLVYFGGPPQQYDLVAVVTETGSRASQEIKAWLKRGCTSRHYPGYSRDELPAGITEVAAITVSTVASDDIEPEPPVTGECPLEDIPVRTPIGGPPSNIQVYFQIPSDCDTGLSKGMTVGGTYTGDLTGKEIWVLVYPINSKYYPQTVDACLKIPAEASHGVWRTQVFFGGPPQQYDVVAIVTAADGEASREFKQWLEDGCRTKNFPGYLKAELPGGITEVAAITVSTKSYHE